MEYEEIRLIKHSEKSTVYLVREKDKDQLFIKKVLKGRHMVYLTLQDCQHPYLPKIYEAAVADDITTVIEEYVEGQSLGSTELSGRQLLDAIKELCSVLEFLHGRNIIHRDIKPSNIIFAADGHIRLIDFDAARMPKDDLEQDTMLLGTRGFAAPEQYGFAQTDVRTDIYALGVTMKQLLGDKAQKPRYRRIIQKCTNLNPDKRYQSVRKVKRAFSYGKRYTLYGLASVLLLAIVCFGGKILRQAMPDNGGIIVLPAPENPHWNGDTGIAVWGNVSEAGVGDGEVAYRWRLYRRDTETPPDLENDEWDLEGDMRGNGAIDETTNTYSLNIGYRLLENGYYYFSVSAAGDGVNYEDSPYALSDVFEYTGENAPMLPAPEGLEWKMFETDRGREYYASWSNLDDYEDEDSFNVWVYDQDGNYVINNIWTKEIIMSKGHDGIKIRKEFLADLDGAYRFTVEAYSSRPNEYRSYLMSDPVPEENFSPWYYRYNK